MDGEPRVTLVELISSVLAELSLDCPPDVSATTRLGLDLGLDSLQIYELMILVEERRGRSNRMSDVPICETAGDVYRWFYSEL